MRDILVKLSARAVSLKILRGSPKKRSSMIALLERREKIETEINGKKIG